MWDYNKLFAEGNIVGLHNVREGETYGWTVVDKSYWHQSGQINWQNYFNSNLSFDTGFYLFEIQYIIRLDDKGQVAKRLFDRDKDMPKPMPKLETGMFVQVHRRGYGYIDTINNRIVYQNGNYDNIDEESDVVSRIMAIYDKNICGFNGCVMNEPIWRTSKYQDKI